MLEHYREDLGITARALHGPTGERCIFPFKQTSLIAMNMEVAPWYPQLRQDITDKAEEEREEMGQRAREAATRANKRAHQEHGVSQRTLQPPVRSRSAVQ